MANYNGREQAPKLVNNKPAAGANFMQIDNELFATINRRLGKSPKQAMLMLYLMGQKSGFGIAQKTVCEALGGISQQSYHKMRNALEGMNFITVTDDSITVNYEAILQTQSEDEPKDLETHSQNEPKQSIKNEQTHSQVESKGLQAHSHNESKEIQAQSQNEPKGVQTHSQVESKQKNDVQTHPQIEPKAKYKVFTNDGMLELTDAEADSRKVEICCYAIENAGYMQRRGWKFVF